MHGIKIKTGNILFVCVQVLYVHWSDCIWIVIDWFLAIYIPKWMSVGRGNNIATMNEVNNRIEQHHFDACFLIQFIVDCITHLRCWFQWHNSSGTVMVGNRLHGSLFLNLTTSSSFFHHLLRWRVWIECIYSSFDSLRCEFFFCALQNAFATCFAN